jgi:glycosyltransferase involved in cell wall biosynthesis
MIISIVIATYNAEETIRRCLESVVNTQAFEGYELDIVVIDGGSTDGTVEIVGAFEEQIGYWESAPDRGLAHAWNKGVSHANGDWIIFLGADDYLWSSDSLEKMAPQLANVSNLTKIVYACVMGVEASGKQQGIWSSDWNRKKFANGGMYFSHQGVFHHKTLFTQYGMFDESYCLALDYELMLRYLVNHDAIFIPGIIVSAMQSGGMSNTPSNAIKTLREFARARRKNNVSQDSINYYRAVIGAYGKLVLVKLLGSEWAARCVKFKKSIFH